MGQYVECVKSLVETTDKLMVKLHFGAKLDSGYFIWLIVVDEINDYVESPFIDNILKLVAWV